MSSGQQSGELHLLRWIALLAMAEAVGMTAAAGAARIGQAVVPDPHGPGPMTLAIALATAGGVVEGSAVGVATARLLRPLAPDLPVRRWVIVTTLVAAIGWAGGTIPSALSGTDDATAGPSRWLVIAGALGLGLLMGAGLGWTQAGLLRHRVSFPLRWVGASALAWAPAMAVIFLGATTPAATWPVPAVLGLAAVTGLLAGSVLGLILGWSVPSLTGTSASGRVLLAARRSPRFRRLVPRGLIGLKVQGARTGTWHSLPVLAAGDGRSLVVLPGRPEHKLWWRNLIRPSRVELLRNGSWEPAEAWVIGSQDHAYPAARAAYRRRFPHIDIPSDARLVRIIPTSPPPTSPPATPAWKSTRR
jgi:hypothetical protein